MHNGGFFLLIDPLIFYSVDKVQITKFVFNMQKPPIPTQLCEQGMTTIYYILESIMM